MTVSYVVVGGSGFLGAAVVGRALADGHRVAVTGPSPGEESAGRQSYRRPAGRRLHAPARRRDPGRRVEPAPGPPPLDDRRWTTPSRPARLLPHLAGRRVTLASTVETLGRRPRCRWPTDRQVACRSPMTTCGPGARGSSVLATDGCPPWRVAAQCRELVDPNGRWTYGTAKRAQELLLAEYSRARRRCTSSGWPTCSARARTGSSPAGPAGPTWGCRSRSSPRRAASCRSPMRPGRCSSRAPAASPSAWARPCPCREWPNWSATPLHSTVPIHVRPAAERRRRRRRAGRARRRPARRGVRARILDHPTGPGRRRDPAHRRRADRRRRPAPPRPTRRGRRPAAGDPVVRAGQGRPLVR